MVVVAFGLVSMRKRRRWTVTRSVLVRSGSAVLTNGDACFPEERARGGCVRRLSSDGRDNAIPAAGDAASGME